MKTYTLENKPTFENNEYVNVDMSLFGIKETRKRYETGRITGKSIEGLLDFWIVDFGKMPLLPNGFQAMTVPHTFIVVK